MTKNLDTLDEVINFLYLMHRTIQTPSGRGLYGIKSLRKSNGVQIPFEEVAGFKISNCAVQSYNSIMIETIGKSHFSIKVQDKDTKQYKMVTIDYPVTSRLFLANLAVVDIYDHCVHFYSHSGIDFSYIEQTTSAVVKAMTEWVHNDHGNIIARWMDKQSPVSQLLEQLEDKRIQIDVVSKDTRNLVLDEMDF